MLPILFGIPTKKKSKSFVEIEHCIREDDWSSFLLSTYAKQSVVVRSMSPVEKSAYYISKGHIQKGYQALGSSPPVQIDSTKLEVLKKIHPPRITSLSQRFVSPFNMSWIDDVIQPSNIFDPKEVLAKVLSHKRHTSPGITKLRFEHLRQCVGNNESKEEQDFLRYLTNFLSLIANASLPASFMRVLGDCMLIALTKPGGTADDVRPIAMGEVYRKLTSSLLVTRSQQKIGNLLGKLQLGVGIKWC
jgi:hypothetical protein